MQTEWGSKTKIQHVAPLSKIKSKARPAKKAESTEEFDLPLAGMMIDSGQQGRSSNVHVKIRAYDMLILMFFYHGRGICQRDRLGSVCACNDIYGLLSQKRGWIRLSV